MASQQPHGQAGLIEAAPRHLSTGKRVGKVDFCPVRSRFGRYDWSLVGDLGLRRAQKVAGAKRSSSSSMGWESVADVKAG